MNTNSTNKKQNSRKYQRKVKHGAKKIVKFHHHRKKVLTYLLFGRFIIILFLLLIQFAVLFYIGHFLNPYLSYATKAIDLLCFILVVYIINNNSKPEFKLSWMIPIVIFPVFGMFFYIFCKLNFGGLGLKKTLGQTTKQLKECLVVEPETFDSVQHTPQIKDISWFLQNSGGFPTYTNFDAKYFPSGEANFEDMLIELKTAQKFIFIEYFIIGMGKVWDSILEILVEKASQGVEVRVMYDGIGSMMLLPSGYPEYLSTLGIKAKIYAPLIPLLSTHQNNRDHRKIFVIDGKVAYTGGINLEDEYMNFRHTRFNYWKDTAIKVTGNAVKSFTAMFLQTWNIKEKNKDDWQVYLNATEPTPLSNPNGFIIPYGDDGLNNEDIAEDVYCDILNKAKWYVHITTPYLILDSQVGTALAFAIKRGVQVSIIVPAKADHFLTFCTGRTFIKSLIDQGVHVYEYMPGFIHAKMFVSDGEVATVGSINLDYRSLYHHFECGAYIFRHPIVKEIERDFKLTMQDCREITAEEYKKIPAIQRLLGRVTRMFAPLL